MMMQGLAQWALGCLAALVIVWLAVATYCSHRWLVRSVAPATAVLLLGAALLFGTDQGRDLGSALVAATLAQRLWFAAALLYWALATWHSARFPLDRAHARWLSEPPPKLSHARMTEPVACGGFDQALPYAPVNDEQAGFLRSNQLLAPLRGVLGAACRSAGSSRWEPQRPPRCETRSRPFLPAQTRSGTD